MPNLFDKIQKVSFDTTLKVFGFEATWQPGDDRPQLCATVHYKEPTQEWEIGEMEYAPNTYLMEYQYPEFPGLYESVKSGNVEHVRIKIPDEKLGCLVEQKFYVQMFHRKFDGKTYRAILVFEENEL